MSNKLTSVVISGGGTGGHIFPALSIANEIRRRYPECDIHFVGARGRMEEEKVPAAGYDIILLPVQGLSRDKNPIKLAKTIFRLIKSRFQVRSELKRLRPQIAIGVGGYASAPTLMEANKLGIPTLVQEQNSFAGKTNKLVGKKAETICVAYKDMERFFPHKKLILAGNPVRKQLAEIPPHAEEAYQHFTLDPHKRTLLVIGGSLGARTINKSISAFLLQIAEKEQEIQLLWQCGKVYIDEARKAIKDAGLEGRKILVTDFIQRMDYAYAIADLVVSRAGASSISELCMLGKPSILVPSPNVAEDHQTKNAQALVTDDAAVMVRDIDAESELIPKALELLEDHHRLDTLGANALKLALPNADKTIVDEIERIVEEKKR
ncbi:undecaprenyldiphospho-muramoylpentapeptide beta-N-acetylglucosaminyltransferase [Porphyromonas levii]|uniref:UDP-N-acetylglucosamine--N-acetylmuramyl-(pentapeptide) pyrophosphoryl-undecaprenol N-acetylglucosamine transferase n=1 Tax=Porphyromonas levii TaxID=28114 RepID=A0A4Y8WN94_9PORP|nr:undecaprenyldiphospho-muramoylpentapeptide beta-N-acetylglucosaminyltransferase [Porphyromonas levii]MBR8703881.1 UDP-N-acetylglucosamine--N-acetylmuramyl-(pentapeptide) pyrophosphoryl-undecaprenol N-acetylglucosamine transferase [Porphyromonas levii]MBR8712183.1 UDP-N-acetylglucosamine--N-acetylmuramyl-(pentapeptide) pyrophosphoryl-undecaprenol N-acetylglucosamine transferase [Porphyromonas levii]MBR8714351.1 UDP-N-acetylglucosamine--N-acetylmuramyl-(pentapeptide) pyrophosphoryl-undecaprenol